MGGGGRRVTIDAQPKDRCTRRRTRRVRPFRGVAIWTATVLLSVVLMAACSTATSTSSFAGSGTRSTVFPQSRLAGPVAHLSKEVTGGNGPFIADPNAINLKSLGYVQHEYFALGTATSYKAGGALAADGRWSFSSTERAAYKTRILVREPANPTQFSGTVVVEWLNVSGGVDADPEWASLYEEIVRQGDAWVGVSAQAIGVMGGPVLVTVPGPGSQIVGEGLRKVDPARYGSLYLPGDGYSFDIYTQVARALRTGAGLNVKPQRLIAAGESQSAFALVTYYDGVQPLTHEFDAFFIHSRGAIGLPLAAPGQSAGIANALSGTPVIFRTDQDAPVIDVQAESDVTGLLDSYTARQPDNVRFRLWEVAGTSHADVHLLGAEAKDIDCGVPINNGPLNLVAKAAYHALTNWIETGTAPVHAPGLDVTPGATPEVVRDSDGIALGGIRTPPVDVPVATLSGVPGPNSSTICLLLGSTISMSTAQLAQLYPSRAVYLARYDADANATIKAGFVLPADRAALNAYADPSAIAG
jgi:hypothetical protein